MGLFSFVGGLIGGGSKKKAAKKASAAQIAAMQKGVDRITADLGQTRAGLLPWQDAGRTALESQMDLLGLGGAGDQQAIIDSILSSPAYTSAVDQGEEGLLANASATGGLRGGNIQAALERFRPQLLTQLINDRLTQFGGLSSQGLNAGSNLGTFGANAARAIADLFSGQGQAKAGQYLATGAINAQNWQNAGGLLDDFAKGGGGGIKGIIGGIKGLF